jgi:hypothetical protein
MKQTAVEWLVNMWGIQGTITPLDIWEAKRIEKKQIIDAVVWFDDTERGPFEIEMDAEQYYNETFNINEK